jgi:hypothetical protein
MPRGHFNCVRVRVSGFKEFFHEFDYTGKSLLPDGGENELDDVVRRIAAQVRVDGGSVVLDVDVIFDVGIVFSVEELRALGQGSGLDPPGIWDLRTGEIRRRLVAHGLSADAISIVIT